MTKLLTIAALALSLSGGVAFAQESSGSDAGGESAGDTTNAPNAPFLGNRDRLGSFFSDEGMTTLVTGDDFTNAYNALSEEDRTQITEECKSDNGQNAAFCEAFTAAGSN